jgi:hypothetical protein
LEEMKGIKRQVDFLDKFTYHRLMEYRFFMWGLSFTNTIYSIMAIINPRNPSHRLVNLIYMVLTMMTVIGLVISRHEKYEAFIVPTSFIVFFRQTVRFLDFEKTKYIAGASDPDPSRLSIIEWGYIVTSQSSIITVFFILQTSVAI